MSAATATSAKYKLSVLALRLRLAFPGGDAGPVITDLLLLLRRGHLVAFQFPVLTVGEMR